jgi:hypothetical protein
MTGKLCKHEIYPVSADRNQSAVDTRQRPETRGGSLTPDPTDASPPSAVVAVCPPDAPAATPELGDRHRDFGPSRESLAQLTALAERQSFMPASPPLLTSVAVVRTDANLAPIVLPTQLISHDLS